MRNAITASPRRKRDLPANDNDEFLTTKELMRLLKIGHRQTVYKLIEQGMPAILVGKNYRFCKDEVIAYFKTQWERNSQR